MKIKFYGVRGSLPVCGREFEKYGGNTTCIKIVREKVNRIAILDAGTGIRKLGKEIIEEGVNQQIINIVFSHFHWDHIQGFPFFLPAYNPNQKIGILAMGRRGEAHDLKGIFSKQMQEEYFPIQMEMMGAQFDFLSYGDEEVIQGAFVKSIPQFHKRLGGSYGFRLDDEGVSLVVCTDLEYVDGIIDPAIVAFAKDADLLIHDGQFTTEEYHNKFKGWGHATWEQAVEVAEQAHVKKLIITHHDPDHNDNFLDDLEKQCQKVFPNSLFAKEGMEILV